ncbi:MAG: type I methionyl aminopeptidase [Candidatus Dojkabacteria bacterium]|nr:MAG: type I methionyl aminopeptidase [Candidatus Dojkabacteria bacterium]
MKKYDREKIKKMEDAGKICSDIMERLVEKAKAGVSLLEIDDLAFDLAKKNNVQSAFLGYEGFPANACIGVNDVVVHGIPTDYELKDGDIVSIDYGIRYKDVFSDMSVTLPIGGVPKEVISLINTTKEATLAGIMAATPGSTSGDIGYAMQNVIESNGFSVVKEFVGHGIGYSLHEDPYVPGYGQPGAGSKLHVGQTLAIEAIVNQGSPEVVIDADDNWTTYTKDGMLSALFEHTIVVEENPKILTDWRLL